MYSNLHVRWPIFYPILTKFGASRQIFVQGPNFNPPSGSSADNTSTDRRTDTRQITGAFLCYANAAKSVDGRGCASVLWRLKIFRPFNEPISTDYLHGVDSHVAQLGKNSPAFAITQVSSRCSQPHLWSLHINVHYFFNIHCNSFFPSNRGLPSVFSFHYLPKIQFVFLNSCYVSCRSLSFD